MPSNNTNHSKSAPIEEGSPSFGHTGEHAYSVLRQRILDGSLAPGQRLLEVELARGLEVSRTPVREAIQRLIVDGLVERSGSRGVIVAELTAEEVEDLYVTRATLEGLAARLAAQHMSKHEQVTLQEIQAQMEAALDSQDSQRLARANFEFHSEILRIARNSTTMRFLAQIHASLRRYGTTTLSLPDRASTAMSEHHELLTALVARDAEAAERIARKHIEGALTARLRILARRQFTEEGPPI